MPTRTITTQHLIHHMTTATKSLTKALQRDLKVDLYYEHSADAENYSWEIAL